MGSRTGGYLFILAIILVVAVYFRGASGLFAAVVNAVNQTGRYFTGQTAPAPAQTPAATKAA